MKNIKTLVGTLMAVVSLSFSSCVTPTRSNGYTICKEMNDKAFQQVDISAFFNVKFVQADRYKVKIILSERFEPYLISEITNGEFNLHLKNSGKGYNVTDNDTAIVEISAPSFKRIKLSGAVRMTLEGNWEVDHALFDLSGASRLQGVTLKADRLSIEQSGASYLNASLTVNELELDNSGASRISLKSLSNQIGSRFTADVSGASKVDLKELPFESVTIDASGAAKAIVNPVKQLKVDASGASSVRYVNSSTELQKNTDKSGAASIKVY